MKPTSKFNLENTKTSSRKIIEILSLKIVETASHETLTKEKKQTLSNGLLHDVETAKRYYVQKDVFKETEKEQKVYEQLISGYIDILYHNK